MYFVRTRIRLIAQLFSLFVALSLCQLLRAAEPAPPAPTITVNVHDPANNSPISGVHISLYGGRGSSDSYTGNDGAAHFQMDLSTGGYIQISASSDGYCPIYWQSNGDAKPPTHFDLLMEKATDIGGIVVDQDGKPLAGAHIFGQVNKKYLDPNLRLASGYISVLTGEDGKWLASDVPEHFDSVALAAYHKECIVSDAFPQPKPFTDIAALRNASATLKLTRGTPVKLLVHGPDGQPIRNAYINFGAGRNDPSQRTDATGTLNLGIKTGTPITLTIYAKGYAPELIRPTIGPTAQTIPINLALGHILEGTILDGNGDPAVNAQISVQSWRGIQTLHPRIRADGDGHFLWPDAPADEVTVYISTIHHGSKGDIKVKAGLENKIQLDPPTRFKGTVIDALSGKTITDYTITFGLAWNPDQPINWNTGIDDAEVDQDAGTFTASFPPDYPQRAVRVIADGYLSADSTPFAMSTKETAFTFKLEKGDPPAKMRSRAPEFTVKTLDGADWSLHNQKGKFVLLYFWSAVFSPGTAQVPTFTDLWKTFGTDPRFTMLGISMRDEDGARTKTFADTHDMHWPLAAIGLTRQSLMKEYPLQQLPDIWLIGPDGTVVAENLKPAQLKAAIADALKNGTR